MVVASTHMYLLKKSVAKLAMEKKSYQDIIVISAHVVNYILILGKTLIKRLHTLIDVERNLCLPGAKNGEG